MCVATEDDTCWILMIFLWYKAFVFYYIACCWYCQQNCWVTVIKDVGYTNRSSGSQHEGIFLNNVWFPFCFYRGLVLQKSLNVTEIQGVETIPNIPFIPYIPKIFKIIPEPVCIRIEISHHILKLHVQYTKDTLGYLYYRAYMLRNFLNIFGICGINMIFWIVSTPWIFVC